MLTLIYLRNGLLLSKRPYASYHEIQEQFFDFKTSLGPYSVDALFEFLEADFRPESIPFVRDQVEAFVASGAELMSGGWARLAK